MAPRCRALPSSSLARRWLFAREPGAMTNPRVSRLGVESKRSHSNGRSPKNGRQTASAVMSAATINPDKELEEATGTAEECDRIVEAQRASMRAREEAQRAKEAGPVPGLEEPEEPVTRHEWGY